MFDYAQENPFVVLNGDDDKLVNVKEVKGSKPVFFGVETKQNVSIDEYEQIGVMGTKAVINYFGHKFENSNSNTGLPYALQMPWRQHV